jgi:DNA (cytosine-5)-methyltransferase 1
MVDESHLTGQAIMWPTPAARDWRSGAASEEILAANARPLNEMAALWPTPRGSDGEKGGPNARDGAGSPHLSNMAVRSSRPDQPTPKDGGDGSTAGRTLNPRFVEALMGWPIGWTDCERPVTGFARFKQRMRSALLRLE